MKHLSELLALARAQLLMVVHTILLTAREVVHTSRVMKPKRSRIMLYLAFSRRLKRCNITRNSFYLITLFEVKCLVFREKIN